MVSVLCLVARVLIPSALAGGGGGVDQGALDALSDIPENRPIQYKERTELDMDGATVEGEIVKPRVQFTTEPPRQRHVNQIRLRTNFDDETAASVGLVR